MAVVLDTESLSPADRPCALEAVFGANEVPQRVRYAAEPNEVTHRLEIFHYGPRAHLMRNVGTGLRIDRTDRHVRQGAPEQLAVFLQRHGVGHLVRAGALKTYRPGDVGLIDTTGPYLWRHASGEHFVLLLDIPECGLSVEKLRLAGDQLARSPIYPVFRTFVSSLCDATSDLRPDAADALGRTAAQLTRALLLTAAEGPGAAEILDETLFVRMVAWADAHLHDPALTPPAVAAAHFISSRQLYKVWSRETGQSPGRWIMARRLDRASVYLADRQRTALPISWVARQCGFVDMSHFSRRFRAVYEMSPRDWAATHR